MGVAGVLVAAFVKGAVGFGFPTLATPLLALFLDVKTAVTILIVPNIVMDGIQALRRRGLLPTLRRHATLYVAGIGGTFAGTYLLRSIADRHALLILGVFVLAFAAINGAGITFRVDPGWERLLSPPFGLLAGVMGGITNVPGTPLVLYFYALGMDKAEFVRSIAVSFLVYKLAQLVAVTQAGLMSAQRFGVSLAATGVGLGAFWLGLRVQDAMDPRTFNRAVLALLIGLGAFLVYRALA